MTDKHKLAASFRDPSGFVFLGDDGVVYRQINHSYAAAYRKLMASGLYADLVDSGLLVSHEEVALSHRLSNEACAVIRPRRVGFISYPYEWCFSALKEAALLTLEIQRRSLDHGMVLKDASAYNVQFDGPKPVFIDTLSFDEYIEGSPWIAYGQFCRHFLAPLAMMAAGDARLGKLAQLHVDGIPLDLASRLLPWSTWLRPGLLMHLHLHGRAVAKSLARCDQPGHAEPKAAASRRMRRSLSATSLRGLIDHLASVIRKLECPVRKSGWTGYYDTNTYTESTAEEKGRLVCDYLDRLKPETVWDLGSNVGVYSRQMSGKVAQVVAMDVDANCVEMNFRACRQGGIANVLPLCVDLCNPSPGVGWMNAERASLIERGTAGAVVALALVHHLAIGNNVPLAEVAAFFRTLSPHLIVEFVPKTDAQVQRMLSSRADIFGDYSVEGFEEAFSRHFRIVDTHKLQGSERGMYLMSV